MDYVNVLFLPSLKVSRIIVYRKTNNVYELESIDEKTINPHLQRGSGRKPIILEMGITESSLSQLKEAHGWNDTEIIIFHKPTVAQVKSVIESVADSDYFLIFFCGHGDSYEGEIILELDNCIDLPLGGFRSWVKNTKNLIICDCCRVAPEVEPIMESLNTRIRMFSEGGTPIG